MMRGKITYIIGGMLFITSIASFLLAAYVMMTLSNILY